ncbi:MAG: polysaccharide deacetylase [Clostridiales bacterium]|nr:polysaccharide deacetylase [Clostridiales bacterium]
MFHGKMKALTFSYDDGVTQDQRLISLLNHYGMKATFNLNSGLLGNPGSLLRENVTVAHVKPRPCEIAGIYKGHEIAAHTLTHPLLPKLPDEEVIRQVEEDRLALSDLAGYEVVGMAYPGGGINFDRRVADVIKKHTGIRYARTTVSSFAFDKQTDLHQFKPTVYHHAEWKRMEEMADRFLNEPADSPRIFYIWGHAYEFDIRNEWDAFEKLLARLAGHSDVFYGTNREILLNE